MDAAGSTGVFKLSRLVVLKRFKLPVGPRLLSGRVLLLLVFSLLFFEQAALVVSWEVEDFANLGTPIPRNLTITQGPHL